MKIRVSDLILCSVFGKINLKEKGMSKYVFKTAVITVLCIIGAIVIVFFALFLFSPKTLGNAFKKTGNTSAAAYFYSRQYNKSGSSFDLAVLIDVYDAKTDAGKVFGYSQELVGKPDFNAFCEEKDAGNTAGVTTAEYYYAKYAISSYYEKGIGVCVQACTASVTLSGYTGYNAFRYVITAIDLSDADKAVMRDKIWELITTTLSETEKTYALPDWASLQP